MLGALSAASGCLARVESAAAQQRPVCDQVGAFAPVATPDRHRACVAGYADHDRCAGFGSCPRE